jgi:hypothetical protein
MKTYMKENIDISKYLDGENVLITTRYTEYGEDRKEIKSAYLYNINEEDVLKFRIDENKEVDIIIQKGG